MVRCQPKECVGTLHLEGGWGADVHDLGHTRQAGSDQRGTTGQEPRTVRRNFTFKDLLDERFPRQHGRSPT
jgi:hypothetical protein